MVELIDKIDINDDIKHFFEHADVTSATYNPTSNTLDVSLTLVSALPFQAYLDFLKKLRAYTKTKVSLAIAATNSDLGFLDVNGYINYFIQRQHFSSVRQCTPVLQNGRIVFLLTGAAPLEAIKEEISQLEVCLNHAGIVYPCDLQLSEPVHEEVMTVSATKPVRPVVPAKKNNGGFKANQATFVTISSLDIEMEVKNIIIEGRLFETEFRERNGVIRASYYVHDQHSALIAKVTLKDKNDLLKNMSCVRLYGSYLYDSYADHYYFKIQKSEVIADLFARNDSAPMKRVEFHLHTNFSDMDGISSVESYIDQAIAWGHKGLVITDHVGVQSFPKAYQKLKKLKKAQPDLDFKIGYGVEMNMVDSNLRIVQRPNQQSLHEGQYVVFDIETTGLSAYFDHIIEFGAVLVDNGRVVDSLQMFIRPPVKIRPFIQEKTNITDDMVAHEKPIEQCIDTILEFFKDRVLVAHNASFDIDFIQENLHRLQRPLLENTVIDTLDFARALYANRRSYRLGNIARFLKINYDDEIAHRADYDAEVLSLVFLRMLRDQQLAGLTIVDDLHSISQGAGYDKVTRYHINLLAKNQTGIKQLYSLISLSHTDYLAFYGKTSKKDDEFMVEPRIPRHEIAKRRENLLIGAGCINSELFEIAANKGQSALENCLSFYDYVEVMPLTNYSVLVHNHAVENQERLIMIIQRIVATAKKMNKLIIASGDVHYNHPHEKTIRDIYIHSQGIGGSRHPLYLYNEMQRLSFVAPDQHFKSTDEMLAEMDYLSEDTHALVIDNPQKLLDSIEFIRPIQDDLFTPNLDNSDELLKDIVYDKAYRTYGNPLPNVVSNRIEKELASIVGHGYGVIYYTSHLLVKKSLQDGYLVGSRGSVGSSLVANLASITEVNPLEPHYVCDGCQYCEFDLQDDALSGYDLGDKNCPRCGQLMRGDGQSIPFETFLGFEGEKVPDIDLNFSGEYQEIAHAYTKELFGSDYVYRAGTISTVARKTAFGYVSGYFESKHIQSSNQAWRTYLAAGAEGVKRTSGQHPGGIIVVPKTMDAHDFTPVQYPANNPESSWLTTHFEYNDIHDSILKLDILGHVDPTAMKMLENLSGTDINTVPINDPQALSVFSSTRALNIDDRLSQEITGALGLPEFGTQFVRRVLEATRPSTFFDLVQISGLTHGTDVWANNADNLIRNGLVLKDVIGCRDDIMIYLTNHGLPSKVAFDIMESVRKGRGLTPEWIEIMRKNKVPDWYIDSCLKIKYMFPKAHAVAYVMMAMRVAWFKVHKPLVHYATYFSLRANAYEIETMCANRQAVARRLNDIQMRIREWKEVTNKERELVDTLEITLELLDRGFRINPISLNHSQATEFRLDPDDDKGLLPPFTVVDGLGANVAKSIVLARQQQEFISKKDMMSRTGLSKTLITKLDQLKVTDHLQNSNQLSLF